MSAAVRDHAVAAACGRDAAGCVPGGARARLRRRRAGGTRRPARARAGFTLVEVLVAVAVAGLAVSAVAGLTATTRRLEARAGGEAAARESLLAAATVMRAVVGNALPDVRADRGEAPPGTPTSLTLLTRGPAILLFDRPRPMTLAVVAAGETADLVLAWADAETGETRREVVLEGARALTFAYFGGRGGAPAAWQGGWRWPRLLPKGVLLRVDLPALGPPVDIVVRTTAELPQACLAMPHEPACRRGGAP